MKKKIAGVLTTVLAASLLVGGNHPVTVQVDNMISGTQDDEDTQSDGAEVEAEEEQSGLGDLSGGHGSLGVQAVESVYFVHGIS